MLYIEDYCKKDVKMKKVGTVLTLLLAMLLSAQADPVAPGEAEKVAERFIKVYGEEVALTVDEIIPYTMDNGVTAYYYAILEPTGWIIVSGDDAMIPVIGYSFENEFSERSQWEESTRQWFTSIDRHIEKNLEKPQLPRHDQWEDLFEENATKSVTGTAVDPFIEVEWDQSSGWNQYCPEDEDGPGGHAYVGCVAVSMAQAMSVYQYPERPRGEHGYNSENYGYIYVDYDNQPAYDWSSMSLTSADDENARLLYHLAVSVDMGFSAYGSGAYTSKAPGVLRNYFGYSESLTYKRRSGYDKEEWKQMLIDELLQGRPIIYSGDGDNGEAGHAFNIDGVGAGGTYYHLNWGWSGSMNGFFTLDDLTPGGSNFSYNQAAVLGIRPPAAGPFDIDLVDLEVYDQQPEGTPVGRVSVEDEFEENVYTYTLKGHFNVLLDDYGPANFYSENDSLKTKKVFDADEKDSDFLVIEVTDTAGNFYREEFTIPIQKSYYGPTAMSLSDNEVEEGKNPGYFVGVLHIEDDITSNTYDYSCTGGYDPVSLDDSECFEIRNDSLFTSRMFYMSEGETYYVNIELTDAHDHSLTEQFEITIVENQSGTAAVKEEMFRDVTFYPNPASDHITLETGRSGVNRVEMEIYSMTGQQCYSCYAGNGERVNLSDLANGTYLVRIKTEEGSAYRKLIIAK